MSQRPLRILHVPLDIGGFAAALAREQRALGHAAVAASLLYSPFGFNGDESHDSPLGTPGRLWRRERGRLRLLARSLLRADVIHCHFGQTLLSVRGVPMADPARAGRFSERLITAASRLAWLRDLPLWRAMGKTVAMTCYGDDVRLVGTARARNPWTHLSVPGIGDALAPRDPLKREMIARLERHCDLIYATNPDLLVDLPPRARLLPYGIVDLGSVTRKPFPPGPLKLLHMPSQRDVKGTSFFVEAVETLRHEGNELSLTLVEGAGNAQAQAAIGEHHLLLDQLRAGWYGGVAVEAMAARRGVMAYLDPADLALVEPGYRAAIPILRTDPPGVTGALRAVLATPLPELRRLGEASRRFAECWHDPRAVAETVIADYEAARTGAVSSTRAGR